MRDDSQIQIIDYDEIDVWRPWFAAIMSEIADNALIEKARRARPQYLEDARNIFVQELGQQALIDHLHDRLKPFRVRVFHGTRVTDDELSQIKAQGLRSLILSDRRKALIDIFQQHPNWMERAYLLDRLIDEMGPAAVMGKREDGCVHVCLSRNGLLRGCNHYLMYGAEVDQHIAHGLFDDRSGYDMLRLHRKPQLISFTAPFPEAACAANPFGFPPIDLPSLLECFLSAWAFSLSHPEYSVKNERDTVALRFSSPITADRLVVEIIDDKALAALR